MARDRLSISTRVVEAVARATDTDPLELPPLYDVVDGDSLDACIAELDDGSLTFTYAGAEVTVASTGTVEVTDTAALAPEQSDGGVLAAED